MSQMNKRSLATHNKQQQWTVKPVTQIATQLRASFASLCAERYTFNQIPRIIACYYFLFY
jgi:hypothetical protein